VKFVGIAIISVLHLPAVFAMAGSYMIVNGDLFAVGVLVGRYLQVLAFLLTVAMIALSSKSKPSRVLIAVTIVGFLAFVHSFIAFPQIR